MKRKNKVIYIIYKITNIITNKLYIGQTKKPLKIRWKEHIKLSKIKDFKFYRSIRKYGIENFKPEILEIVTKETINEREKYWIKKLDTYKNGYNSTLGGGDNPMNYKEYRDKVGESKKGKKYWLGKKHTDKTKIKMSKSAIGRKRTIEDKKKQSETRKRLHLGAKSGFDHFNSKSIAQLDDNGNILKIFGSIREAEIFINKKRTGNIHRVLNPSYSNKTAFGYKWKILSEEEIKILQEKNKFKKVS